MTRLGKSLPLVVGLLTLGCQSKLPGPIACEDMARAALSRSRKDIAGSPLAKKVVATVVHGCLTTPFDQQALKCVESGQSFARCMDQLASRAPERAPALRRFSASLRRLDNRGRIVR